MDPSGSSWYGFTKYLNSCWFHSSLHLLTAIPLVRQLCLSSPSLSRFDEHLLTALRSILNSNGRKLVQNFFLEVSDFKGSDNRYGQIAVPDFIEFICERSTALKMLISHQFHSILKCSVCKWISPISCNDIFLKLYIPSNLQNNISLSDLCLFNSETKLSANNAVMCGKCNKRTSHSQTYDYNPDIFLIEIVRVRENLSRWNKNSICISFPIRNLVLKSFSRKYRVVASCHHTVTIKSGHWFSKILTAKGWFLLDDLKSNVHPSCPPGVQDNSAVILLLVCWSNSISLFSCGCGVVRCVFLSRALLCS